MAVGDTHNINGYVFTETEHGPNVERQCIECGKRAYATPDATDVRCLDHARACRNVPPVSVKPKRRRFLRERGAAGLTGDVAHEVDEIKMAAARKLYAPGGLCVRCRYPLDPVHRQEGYDTHPICEVENG